MIYGHGDDGYAYPNIRINFSSNCYYGTDNSILIKHLQRRLPELIASYPHPDGTELKQIIARKKNLSIAEVAVFNGATEVIYEIARNFRPRKTYIAVPTFSEYESACRLSQHTVEKIDLDLLRNNDEWKFSTDSMFWLCNPNNPDGRIFPAKRLYRLIRNNPATLFVIDQSYAAFTKELAIELAKDLPNLLLIHSLTKQYAIPGLRLGYVIGSPNLIKVLERNRMPWSVNALALEAGMQIFLNETDFSQQCLSLLQEVKNVQQQLEETGKIETFPSDTHFFLAKLKQGSAARLKEQLALRYGILIRDAANFSPHFQAYFRIAVRSSAENDQLIDAIKHILNDSDL